MVTDNLLFMKDLDSRFGEGGREGKREEEKEGKEGGERSGEGEEEERGGKGLTVSGKATH